MKVARVYLRVSTKDQDLRRQASIIDDAKQAGYYIAGVYREQASGARADRPGLMRLIADLQPGEAVVAEKMDRISRLPLDEAEKLVASIRERGAKIAVPGVIDLSELAEGAQGVAKIVLEHTQALVLRIALQTSRDEYEARRERQRQGIAIAKQEGRYVGRKPNDAMHAQVVAFRTAGHSIAGTAKLAGCSTSQVKRIWANHKAKIRAHEIEEGPKPRL